MHFLPDVYVQCEVCQGERFNRQTLEVKYKGKSIAEVLSMPVEEARGVFANIPRIKNILDTLYDVGLGYIQLGQSATTLSGGEAQRVKLSSELSRRATGNTLYLLDEPTTGLHFADVDRLLAVLGRLVDKGNTVVVIEHNLDVIKRADYIIDLGPEGGDLGGNLVICGSPREVAECEESYTGRYLRKVIDDRFPLPNPSHKGRGIVVHCILLFWCFVALVHPLSYAATDEKEAFYSQAWSRFEEGKFEEAQGLFAEFKNRFSDPVLSEEADYKIAECLYNLKDYPALKSHLRLLFEKYPPPHC